MANTVDQALQTDVILDSFMEELKAALLPIHRFTTRFSSEQLSETRKMLIPYVPCQPGGASDLACGDCYSDCDTETEKREVAVDRRKYVCLSQDDCDFTFKNAFEIDRLAKQKAYNLASAVIQDILSVVTAANYGAATFTGPPTSFDVESVLDLQQIASERFWPTEMRYLLLNAAYHRSLAGDTTILRSPCCDIAKDALQTGRFGEMLFGFDYNQSQTIPANGENLVGMALIPSAILVGSAVIAPPPGVRQRLIDYREVTDDETGLTFVYKHLADENCNKDKHIIEVSYGYAVGEANGIQRIVSA